MTKIIKQKIQIQKSSMARIKILIIIFLTILNFSSFAQDEIPLILIKNGQIVYSVESIKLESENCSLTLNYLPGKIYLTNKSRNNNIKTDFLEILIDGKVYIISDLDIYIKTDSGKYDNILFTDNSYNIIEIFDDKKVDYWWRYTNNNYSTMGNGEN